MCFNPGPERRVPSPNRYIADAKFCFCKNNKRIIITIILLLCPPGLIRGNTNTHPPPHMTCMVGKEYDARPVPHPGPRAEGARRGRAVACARGGVGGPPAAARRRPTAVFVRGATETAPDGFGIPGNTMGLATGASAGLRAGHDVCRAPGSAARWRRAGRGGCAWPL